MSAAIRLDLAPKLSFNTFEVPMKYFLMIILFFSFHTQAASTVSSNPNRTTTTEYIYTSGRGTGFCDGNGMSWYCYDQIKNQAKQEAVRNAHYSCSAKSGQLDEYSAYCNYFCSPFSIPQGDPTQYVQCSADCNSRCVITN